MDKKKERQDEWMNELAKIALNQNFFQYDRCRRRRRRCCSAH